MLFKGRTKQPPSLVELCVRIAIDNVRYIGYVGGVDFELLDQIFQHCTLEHLIHIEDSTQDTDLSPVTNEFWKRFYKKKQYGEKNLNDAMEKMKRKKVNFKWRELYEAKSIEVQEREKEVVDRLKQRYKNEDERKQSRQTKLCSKAPPTKRPFWGSSASGYNLSSVKGNIIKKAKLDLLKSQEVKNLTAIKRNTIQKSFRGRDYPQMLLQLQGAFLLVDESYLQRGSTAFLGQIYLQRESAVFLGLLIQLQKMQPADKNM